MAGSLLGNIATLIMVAGAAGICAYEFYFMLRSDAKLPNEALGIAAAVAFPISYFFFQMKGVILVTAALIIMLLIWYVFWRHARIADVCISFFGAIYTGFLLTCLLALRMAIPGDEI
ncbi:MAG: hypothetical protein Q4F54_04980 [Coriobacteriia bacterium]|nr:hypothetical protein [Coriobacteriia bacterium]